MIQKIYDLSPHVDPNLVDALNELPEWKLDVETLPYIRQFNAAEPIAAPPGSSIENLQLPVIGEGSNGENHEVPVPVYRPDALDPGAPALIWIHEFGSKDFCSSRYQSPVASNINTAWPSTNLKL